MTEARSARRIGIDLGGTKISAVALDADGDLFAHNRVATPRDDYPATLTAIKQLVVQLDTNAHTPATIGIGIPGSLAPDTKLVRNANSTWLNGQDLSKDLTACLGRPVRIANDADCFVVSEAKDGAGVGQANVWGIILGTGCGSGVVLDGKLLSGRLRIAGEWGHNPLPWPTEEEQKHSPTCWCGQLSCLEAWVSGPALSRDHQRHTGTVSTSTEIAANAAAGCKSAQATLDRHLSRLARGMAAVVNILDPDVIVIGGGLSHMSHLFEALPTAMAPYVFSNNATLSIKPPRWGDDSGVRGAAWLWT